MRALFVILVLTGILILGTFTLAEAMTKADIIDSLIKLKKTIVDSLRDSNAAHRVSDRIIDVQLPKLDENIGEMDQGVVDIRSGIDDLRFAAMLDGASAEDNQLLQDAITSVYGEDDVCESALSSYMTKINLTHDLDAKIDVFVALIQTDPERLGDSNTVNNLHDLIQKRNALLVSIDPIRDLIALSCPVEDIAIDVFDARVEQEELNNQAKLVQGLIDGLNQDYVDLRDDTKDLKPILKDIASSIPIVIVE